MYTRTIRQSVVFKASAHDVYEALMDPDKHSLFTESEAHISREIGGRFSAFGGYSEGVNLEIIPDKRIVQSWRAGDWPEGHYSRATFSLKEKEGVTHLTFTQSGVPEDQFDDISQGWYDYYWQPMKQMLER